MNALVKTAMLLSTTLFALPAAPPPVPLDLTYYNVYCEYNDPNTGRVRHWEKKRMLNKDSAQQERDAHDKSCTYANHSTRIETEVISEPPAP